MTHHAGLPGTVLVLVLKIPYPKKNPSAPGKQSQLVTLVPSILKFHKDAPWHGPFYVPRVEHFPVSQAGSSCPSVLENFLKSFHGWFPLLRFLRFLLRFPCLEFLALIVGPPGLVLQFKKYFLSYFPLQNLCALLSESFSILSFKFSSVYFCWRIINFYEVFFFVLWMLLCVLFFRDVISSLTSLRILVTRFLKKFFN